MFLRIAAVLMLVLLPLYADAAMITTARYEHKDAETDITILKSILSRHPDDLKTIRRLIDLTFELEYFDQAEKYCDRYLAIEKNIECAYMKIISEASRGNLKHASDLIDPFIEEYRKEMDSRDLTLLKYRENIYRQSADTASYPDGAKKTAWGSDLMIKTFIPRDNLFIGYNFIEQNHSPFKINGNSMRRIDSLPESLSGLPAETINSVSLSDDGREILASSRSGDSSEIFIRKYLPEKKGWSSWKKPGGLNPGKWNHYPTFVNSDIVIFSSSDGADYDFYISKRDINGEWSKAGKLSGINTPFDEISAWAHPDGETLYFSSNGYAGKGGFDIYGARLTLKDNSLEVTGIKNITSANTFRNEKYALYVSSSGDSGYFNFTQGSEHMIYSCNQLNIKPEPVFFYNADISDDATGKPVNGAAAEYKISGSGLAFSRPVYIDGFTGATLRRNLKYTITLTADGYEPFSKTISFTGKDGQDSDTINDKIRLKRKAEKATAREFTTLITSLKLIDCEDSKALYVQKSLEKGSAEQGGNNKTIQSLIICGNTGCALTDGKTVGADFVIFGTLRKTKQSAMKTLGDTGEDQYLAKRVSGTAYILELKLLDISTGRVILSLKKTAADNDALKIITEEFIKKSGSYYKGK